MTNTQNKPLRTTWCTHIIAFIFDL